MIPPLKLILRVALTLQKRRVNCIENKVVLCAREVQKTQTVYVALILRRDGNLTC